MSIFKYIIFLIFYFNILTLHAAEVIFEPIDDETQKTDEQKFEPSLTLPHPAQFREILLKSSDSSVGRLFALGKYFDERYPNDALNVDFRQDVALIFPELSAQDVSERTRQIKLALKLYREGKKKYNEIKEKIITPKEPPLIVADDEYAIIGDREYVPTKEGEVAIISDFKKVISYGKNPRELEAMEAYRKRLQQAKKRKTSFEKFQEKLSQIEFSKIPDYGVTIPSPFAGDAGIGSWVEEKDFKARLVSNLARVGQNDELIIGLHVSIPNHRFMLASTLDENLKKPNIQITDDQNVSQAELLYPLSVPLVNDKMIGAYRGNFAFPIKIKLKEKNKPLSFVANFTFNSCDSEFECEQITLNPQIFIDAEETGDEIDSAVNNFVMQSYYNIPQEQNKFLKLENISLDYDQKKQNIQTLSFDFKYDTSIRGFSLLLKNSAGTTFSFPKVIITRDHIYVQTAPLENKENLLETPLTLTARINNFATLRQTINLQNFASPNESSSMVKLFVLGFLLGILFYITPLGLPFLLQTLALKNYYSNPKKYIYAKTTSLLLFVSIFSVFFYFKKEVAFLNLQTDIFWLSCVLIYLLTSLLSFNKLQQTNEQNNLMCGLTSATLIIFLLPVFHTFYQEDFLTALNQASYPMVALSFGGLLTGLIAPDIFSILFLKKPSSENFIKLINNLKIITQIFTAVILFYMVTFQITWGSVLKLILILMIGLFVSEYFLTFKQALFQTDLKPAYIKNTKRVINFLIAINILIFAHIIQASVSLKPSKHQNFDMAEFEQTVQKEILKGQNVLVAFENRGCLICQYNNLTLLNKRNLDELKQKKRLTYIFMDATNASPQMQTYFAKFKRVFPPLYVFYNPFVPNGVVLPKLLTPSELNQTLENFKP